ncbi:MAG: SCP2 domain-containing protein [Hyphomicrobiales bacterium]
MPPGLLGPVMQALVRQSARNHPDLFARLGEHATKVFEIAPTDLAMTFMLRPDPRNPQITLHRYSRPAEWDCRIAGPLAALLGMIHGAYDGDALFFSRDIVIEGDTAAGLALRNAIDNAELDLFEEALALLGPLKPGLGAGLRPLVASAGRRLGVALQRVEL